MSYSSVGTAFVLFFGFFGLAAIICLVGILSAPEKQTNEGSMEASQSKEK